MVYHDIPYLSLVKDVLQNGVQKSDRTGTGTTSVFGRQMRFDLSDGTIPLLTTKKIYIPAIIHELLWYLQGTGNIKYLQDNNVKIWNQWADENGNLGKIYGVLWRNWYGIDQITNTINKLKTNPMDRRLIVTAWDPSLVPDTNKSFSENVADGKQALPPCHYTFQFNAEDLSQVQRVRLFSQQWDASEISTSSSDEINFVLDSAGVPKHKLSLMLNMRSNDVFLGNPFNIVQYSILLRMVCEVVGMAPGDFVWSGGDVHIYSNHIDQLSEQLSRDPYPSPTLKFARKITDIDDFKYDDFIIENYQCHPAIIGAVAV